MPRALWVKAPLALFRHRVGFLAVVCAAFLVAVGAAAGPLLNASVESEALQSKLQSLTPLAAGLVIDRPLAADSGSIGSADARRRAAAVQLGRTLPSVGSPVLTTTSDAQLVGSASVIANPLPVVLMARTGAKAHVHKVAGRGGPGVWLSHAVAANGVHAGGRVAFVPPFPAPPGAGRVSLPVAALYRQLDSDLADPYWVNFVARIRAQNPDSPLPPTFALVSRRQIYRLAEKAGGGALANVYEFPLDTSGMTSVRARRIAQAFQHVDHLLATRSSLAKRLGCAAADRPCRVSSELTDAVVVADAATSNLRPVVDLMAGFCLLIALCAALVAGVFTGRRRTAESRLSLVRGEARPAFLMRAAIEAFIPTVVGAGAGLAVVVELVRAFTPQGSVDASVVRQAAARVVLSISATVFAVAVGLTLARGRLGAGRAASRKRLRLPWEAVVIGAALGVWFLLVTGGGLVTDSVGGSHPRLVVLVLPVLVAAPLAGLTARVLRSVVVRRTAVSAVAVFLALRRVAASRGLVIALIVAVAAAIASLAFAEILQASLAANNTEKALVANGSDVQGLIDSTQHLPASFPFPATKVEEVFAAGTTDSGRPFEVIAVDPPSLARVLASHWPRSVRSAVHALGDSDAPLPAIGVGIGTGRQDVTIAGARTRVQIVARVRAFPGMQPSQALLVIPVRALTASPATALTYVWATGPPRQVAAALSRSGLSPSYLTTLSDFSRSPDVQNISRTYRVLKIFGFAIAGLGLVALMLYVSSRQRSQLIPSAFLRRMGVTQPDQAWSVALESMVLVAVATVAGLAAALVTANVIVGRVDPLSQYSPAPATAVPWELLVASGLGVILVSGAVAASLVLVVRRSDVGEELRVS